MAIENNKTKKHFSRQFKRMALLEYAKGKKPSQIFFELGVKSTDDKKYASKLINKWKQELYKNINLISLSFVNINSKYAKQEIDSIGDDGEIDTISEELLTKNNNSPLV